MKKTLKITVISQNYPFYYDMMKIHVLNTGFVRISKSLAFRDVKNNPSLAQLSIISSYGRKNRMWFPVSSYIIEHESYLILFDCGWSQEMSPEGKYSRISQIRHMSLPLFLTNQGFIDKDKSVDKQIEALGFKTPDYVILSHLDVDHVSGLNHVNDCENILVSSDELDFASRNRLRYQSKMWKNVNLKTFDFQQKKANIDNGPVGRVYDLLGDGCVELVNIPGHTPGLTAMKLNSNDKSVLLFSDGGYGTKSWKDMILPGICDDEKSARKSLQWIREFSNQKKCIESLANHDFQVKPHVIEL